MEWAEITPEQATAAQRRALYRWLVTGDGDRLRDLIRSMTTAEAAAVLAVLGAVAGRSSVLSCREKQEAEPVTMNR